MKKILLMVLFLPLVVVASMSAPTAHAFANTWKPFNNQFLSWQEEVRVVHLFVYDDVGTTGQPIAVVPRGRLLLMGFEVSGASVAELQADYLDNPDHDVLVSQNGGPFLSFKDWYQPPFVATPGSGPRWSWDHDGDGLGDGDGDGIDDWEGAVMFMRLQHPGNSQPGLHTFEIRVTNDGGVTLDDVDVVTFLVE